MKIVLPHRIGAGFTEEQEFAYRLRKLLYQAWRGGALWAKARPDWVLDDSMQFFTAEELMEDEQRCDPVGYAFREEWSREHRLERLESSFGLSARVVEQYFPQPPRK